VARALLPWRSPFAPLWKTPPGLLRGAFSVLCAENAPHNGDSGSGGGGATGLKLWGQRRLRLGYGRGGGARRWRRCR
jgi:hypothetical protein